MLHLRPCVREHGQGGTALETFHGQKKPLLFCPLGDICWKTHDTHWLAALIQTPGGRTEESPGVTVTHQGRRRSHCWSQRWRRSGASHTLSLCACDFTLVGLRLCECLTLEQRCCCALQSEDSRVEKKWTQSTLNYQQGQSGLFKQGVAALVSG